MAVLPTEVNAEPRPVPTEVNADLTPVPTEVRVEERPVPTEVKADLVPVPTETNVEPRPVPTEVKVVLRPEVEQPVHGVETPVPTVPKDTLIGAVTAATVWVTPLNNAFGLTLTPALIPTEVEVLPGRQTWAWAKAIELNNNAERIVIFFMIL